MPFTPPIAFQTVASPEPKFVYPLSSASQIHKARFEPRARSSLNAPDQQKPETQTSHHVMSAGEDVSNLNGQCRYYTSCVDSKDFWHCVTKCRSITIPAYSFPPTRSSDERKARVKRGFWHDSSFLEGAITVVILVIDSHRTLRRVSDNMEASGLNGKSLDSET